MPIWQSEVISNLSEVVKGNLYPAIEQCDSNLNINYLNGQQISIQRTQTRERDSSSSEMTVILSENAMQI